MGFTKPTIVLTIFQRSPKMPKAATVKLTLEIDVFYNYVKKKIGSLLIRKVENFLWCGHPAHFMLDFSC